jgi:hypothetical protein
MSRRPTGRGIIVTVVGAVIFLAAGTTQAGWLFVMAMGALGTVLGSAFVPHRLKSLWVGREIHLRTDLLQRPRDGERIPRIVIDDSHL